MPLDLINVYGDFVRINILGYSYYRPNSELLFYIITLIAKKWTSLTLIAS